MTEKLRVRVALKMIVGILASLSVRSEVTPWPHAVGDDNYISQFQNLGTYGTVLNCKSELTIMNENLEFKDVKTCKCLCV